MTLGSPDDREGALPADRRSGLLGAKLSALAGEHVGEPVAGPSASFPSGAALLHRRAAWVLVEGAAHDALGRALAWTVGHDAESLELVVDGDGDGAGGSDAGLLARRAACFQLPIRVWTVAGRTLQRRAPEPLAAPPPPAPAHLLLRPLIAAGGADPLVEHGIVSGEVRGLEVCRVVDRPTTGFLDASVEPSLPTRGGGAARGNGAAARSDGVQLEVGVGAADVKLEVGVGAADREAFQLLHGDLPTVEALAAVVERVAAHRSPSAPQHPLNRLAAERYLRWRCIDDPASIGLRALQPAEPPVPRRNLKDPVPCVAAGIDADARPVTAVFSSGVDLDLLPFVADVAATTEDRLLVVLRARDLLPITRRLAGLLTAPVELATVG